MSGDVTIDEVKRIHVGPGDKVLLRTSYPMSREQIEGLRESLDGVFPDNQVIVLEQGLDIEVAES